MPFRLRQAGNQCQGEQNRRRTLEEFDLQIAVRAADAKLSSCKQSSSPSTIPGAEGLENVAAFELEKNVENIFLGLSKDMGDVGVRDIMVVGDER